MNDDTSKDPEPQAEPPTKKYKTITQEEFDEKLKLHHEWLELDEDEQKKQVNKSLVLQGYDLSHLELHGEDMRQIDFQGSNLWGAHLDKSNLTKANLCSADFRGASLNGANLREALLFAVDLRGAFLTGADLSKANLYGSFLEGTMFNGANLTEATFIEVKFRPGNEKDKNPDYPDTGEIRPVIKIGNQPTQFHMANLTNANFMGVDFKDADLTNANFRDAILHKADLREAATVGINFGGASLTNARLPEEIQRFDGLKTVEDSSRITRTLFLAYLTLVAFCFLTIASTTDIQLISKSSSFPLPIFQVLISTQSFYLYTPIIIVLLFFYFQIYLYQHYQLIAKLPAVFPDGSLINEKLYPWILNTWTQGFFSILPKGFFLGLKKCIVIFICWVLAPVTLIFFLGRYLVAHDPSGTELHRWLIYSSVVLALIFLCFIERRVFRFTSSLVEKICHFVWAFLIIVVSVYIFNLPTSIGFGQKPFGKTLFGISTFTDISKYFYRANFSNRDISFRAEMWNPQRPLVGVKGADLENAQLEWANGSHSFLVKANLSKSNLSHVNFRNAKLQKADISRAILVNANLFNTNLQGAYLREANFKGANFYNANIQEADLKFADLRGAKHLEPEQVKKAKNWGQALYDNSFRKKLGITDDQLRSVISDYQKKVKKLLKYYGLETQPKE